MDINDFFILICCSIASAFVPTIIGLINLRLKSHLLKSLWLLIFLAFAIDILGVSIRSFSNEFGNAYRLIEFILLLRVYYFAFESRALKGFVAIGLIYTIFFVADLFFFQPAQLNSFSITLTSLVFIIFSILYFLKLMRDLPTTQIQKLPMFWINTAVLVYFAGSFFVFLLRNYLIEVLHDNQILYWSFHNILNIIKNLLFAIGLWQGIRKPLSNSL